MISKERKILSYNKYKTGFGTHHYDVKYVGEWEEWALINCIDRGITEPSEEEYEANNKDCGINYGGYVEPVYETEDIKRARVGIYYD